MKRLRRDNSELIEKISKKLLKSIEERLDEGAGLELKDYKTVTGALKELREYMNWYNRTSAPVSREGTHFIF